MGNVNDSGIWTPDEDDNLDPEVWSAAMGDSIHNGLGIRMNRQEAAIGLKAGITASATVNGDLGQIAPYEVLESFECFTQGLELDGGVATISVPGMYFVSCSAALESVAVCATNEDRSIALQIYHDASQVAGCEVMSANGIWQTAQANCVLNCIEGDTIHVRWYSAGPVVGEGFGTLADNTAMHTLSIVLVTPIGA
jgi:hypothetical protein